MHPFYISQPRKRPTFLCVLSKAKMSEGAARLNELDFIICANFTKRSVLDHIVYHLQKSLLVELCIQVAQSCYYSFRLSILLFLLKLVYSLVSMLHFLFFTCNASKRASC
jgi:hypothetical protein